MKRGERLPEDEIGIEAIEEEELSPPHVDAIVSLLFRWWLREYEAPEQTQNQQTDPKCATEKSKPKS